VKPGSLRTAEGNVISLTERHSTADRYSRIDVVGSGSGNTVHYGTAVSSRFGTARDSIANEDGTGRDFKYPKRLLMLEGVQSIREAIEVADREMSRREMDALRFTVTAPLHGQRIAGARDVTLFACDTLAVVENEATGTRITCMVIGLKFATDRSGGEVTELDLMPDEQPIFL
jgi:prophage tail gpP-like protein